MTRAERISLAIAVVAAVLLAIVPPGWWLR